MAIMSVSSVVGFGYLGDILRVRGVTGLIADTVRQEELKVLRGDFESATVHFLTDYMVIEEFAEDAELQLTLNKNGPCVPVGNYEILISDSGNLTKKDGDGAILKIESVTPPSKCIIFKNSKDTEWQYQLTSGNEFSNVIRFIHFNIQREDLKNSEELSNPVYISSGNDSKVVISAPYAKKNIYDDNSKSVGWVELTVKDSNDNSQETLTVR